MENIVTVEVQAKLKETQELANTYENYIVTDNAQYKEAADDLRAIKTKAKELAFYRMDLTRPIEESKKKIIAMFKVPLGFLSQAEASVKKAMVDWQDEQESIRREEQQRLDRLQQEKEAALRKAAEKEEARIANLKTYTAKKRAQAKADELAAQADATAVIETTVKSKVEEVYGISTREVWKFKIINSDLIPREYMIPDEKYIGDIVRQSKGKKEIKGVRIYSENIIASR